MTSNDIRNRSFTAKRGRYDGAEVDAFLEKVSDEFEKLAQERDELKKQMTVLSAKVDQYEQMEAALRGALVNAQRLADETVAQARLDAQEITAQADAQAAARIDGIVAEAQAQKEMLADIKAVVAAYKQQVRELMNRQLDLLEVYCTEE